MPTIAPIQVSGILRRFMTAEGLTITDVSKKLHVCHPTISKFLKGKSNPQRETMELIQMYLQEEGAMTRFGFPADVPPPTSTKPTPQETGILSEMGIESPDKGKHYVCSYLSDWDFVLLVRSLSSLPEPDAKRLLGSLCQESFPSLS